MAAPGRLVAAVLAAAVLGTSVTGCSDDTSPQRGSEPAGTPAPKDAAREINRLLRQRADALVRQDDDEFRRTVQQSDAAFADAQATYFANLAQLPVAEAGYRLDRGSLVQDGDDVWAEVEMSLRLFPYDDEPVVTRDRYRFTPAAGPRGERLVLSSVTDQEWEAQHAVTPQPWDLGPVRVEERAGVLGVFDDGTIAQAPVVLDAVEQARNDVVQVLPEAVPDEVVVYALSDSAYVESIPALPVDPERLDALTVPVTARPADPDKIAEGESPATASYRMVLSPTILLEDTAVLDRLVRHELTHVLLGDRGRLAPLWLSEGIAEWVSVRPMAPSERRLSSRAVALVEGGLDALPPDDAFSGTDAEGWYAVAWWICEYVAATYGESVLWTLLDALDVEGAAAQEAALQGVLGISGAELAERGAALMASTYG